MTQEEKQLTSAALLDLLNDKQVEYFDGKKWALTGNAYGICQYPHRPIQKPAWKLPDPPEGRKWHRTDWTEDMLPEGCRPLLASEMTGQTVSDVDWMNEYGNRRYWHKGEEFRPSLKGAGWFRTRRPLPTPPKLRPWTHEEIPVGKVIKTKCGRMVRMITGKNDGEIHTGIGLHTSTCIMEHYTMDDGSPCGVLE